ncbi:solute carrier family 22 member 1-like isoform X1 [Plodia interpunctella]|uniref:solute carrier family 22 member 1-like isoform X1 n=1 Tax=Plodia interpunctella TaxID=58824 RepID=UPI0023678D99|nr:solute carrier family 22 member 1-like isoform X1 [Plodia interpunctella]
MTPSIKDGKAVPFEIALDQTGFGWYSGILTALAGMTIISFMWISTATSIIIPSSVCELNTTSAQQGLMAAAPVVRSVMGAAAWGYLADRRGRRKMLMWSLFLGSTVNALASLSVNWIMLMILQFLATAMVAGQYVISMTLLSESVPMAKRNVLVLLVNSIFMLAQGLMAASAIPIMRLPFSYHLPALDIYWNSWRTVLLIYSVPSLICLCWLYCMKESPKFVLVNGDELGAIKILKVIHKINKNKNELEVAGLIRPDGEQTSLSAKEQMRPLFRRPLLKTVVIMTTLLIFQLNGPFIIWLPRIADQFMTILQSGESDGLTLCKIIELSLVTPSDPNAVPCALNETALMLVLIVGVFQCAANVIVSLLVDMVGRRNMVMIVTSICGLAGILVNLVPNAIASAALFVLNLVGQLTLGLYTAISVAIIPTQLRAMAIALSITADRICTFASVQILNYLLENYCEVGFYVYSAIFASSALVAYLLPDDRRRKPHARNIIISKL